jgi:hypothetical protein
VSAAAAAGPLDRAGAQLLTLQLRQALDLVVELIDRAVAGRVWLALGYKSWPEYCAAELPQLADLVARATVPERQAVVVALRREGVSLRGIAGPLGISASQVKLDADAAGAPKLATVVGLDGRTIATPAAQAPRPKPAARPLVDRVVELLAAHPDGLDVLTVAKALRVRQAQASPALCRLAAAGRVEYLRPARRGQLGRYTAGTIES